MMFLGYAERVELHKSIIHYPSWLLHRFRMHPLFSASHCVAFPVEFLRLPQADLAPTLNLSDPQNLSSISTLAPTALHFIA
jgi:hypothetical protein